MAGDAQITTMIEKEAALLAELERQRPSAGTEQRTDRGCVAETSRSRSGLKAR